MTIGVTLHHGGPWLASLSTMWRLVFQELGIDRRTQQAPAPTL